MDDVRKLATETDFARFVDIAANAYTGIFANTPEEKQKFKEILISKQQDDPAVEFYGLFRKQQLIAVMRFHYYEMNLHSKICKIGGVGLVAVDLLHKKERAAKKLIERFLESFKEKGVHLVALYPFRPDFYKKMGFGYGANQYQYFIEPSSFPTGPTKEHLTMVNEKDIELLAACYNRFTQKTHGMIYKTEFEWKAVFKNPENRIVAFRKNDKIQGYIVFAFKKQSDTNFMRNNLIIKEFVYETPDALMEISTFLNSQADQVSRIEWNTQDEKVRFLVKDARNGSPELIPSIYHPSATSGIGLMYRIINVKGFLQQLNAIQFYAPDVRWKLTVTDSFFVENQGEYVVHIKNGVLELSEEEDYEVEVKIDIAELTSLLMGAVKLKELYMYSKVEISDPIFLNILDSLFTRLEKPICMTAF